MGRLLIKHWHGPSDTIRKETGFEDGKFVYSRNLGDNIEMCLKMGWRVKIFRSAEVDYFCIADRFNQR